MPKAYCESAKPSGYSPLWIVHPPIPGGHPPHFPRCDLALQARARALVGSRPGPGKRVLSELSRLVWTIPDKSCLFRDMAFLVASSACSAQSCTRRRCSTFSSTNECPIRHQLARWDHLANRSRGRCLRLGVSLCPQAEPSGREVPQTFQYPNHRVLWKVQGAHQLLHFRVLHRSALQASPPTVRVTIHASRKTEAPSLIDLFVPTVTTRQPSTCRPSPRTDR